MKVIIAGSRNITDYTKLLNAIKVFIQTKGFITEVISGGAKGIDSLAVTFATNEEIPCKVFKADWKNLNAPMASIKRNQFGFYNARAGLDRNTRMAEYGEALIAIWDGKSKGTLDMINKAKEKNLTTLVVTIE